MLRTLAAPEFWYALALAAVLASAVIWVKGRLKKWVEKDRK